MNNLILVLLGVTCLLLITYTFVRDKKLSNDAHKCYLDFISGNVVNPTIVNRGVVLERSIYDLIVRYRNTTPDVIVKQIKSMDNYKNVSEDVVMGILRHMYCNRTITVSPYLANSINIQPHSA